MATSLLSPSLSDSPPVSAPPPNSSSPPPPPPLPPSPVAGGAHDTNSQRGHRQNWPQIGETNPNDNVVTVLPPPPGTGSRLALPPPPPPRLSRSNGHMRSSDFSGPLGPVLPPRPPSLALGFDKSTFTYDELMVATTGFAKENLLGEGGFWYVHKGVLPNGKAVAVKSLKSGNGQGNKEFQTEVETISRVRHRNLVSLVGYCIASEIKMLVYDFIPNSNLEFHLHGRPCIIHGDIKTSNILLDFNFEAKVADFGLTKLYQDKYAQLCSGVKETFGYLAPEYASRGKLTDKSDVFSLGVILLELITGRCPDDHLEESFVDWARPLCLKALEDGNYDELVDPRLENNYAPHEMTRMVACAATSIRHSARQRPKMSQFKNRFKTEIALEQIVLALIGDISLEDLNEEVKPCQSSNFASSSDKNDPGSYSAKLRKFRTELDSQENGSSGATSEYGLDPSSSSDISSHEISRNGSRFHRNP
ncbi:hypothetical protein TIFTF001_006785 [Ficus carica]|uniref:non-specific serine/threonine protein kinase n=1 Tax=Ficus carica TaxID=3494 RepID=A0AA88D172_FICCA|nr:hypothetical protein TIFTF001_006785 [Ficus carica]